MAITLAQLNGFYHEASAATFASGREPDESEPGKEIYRYDSGDFSNIDIHLAYGNNRSVQTEIWHAGAPIYFIQYLGQCLDNHPEAWDFLKQALLDGFTSGRSLNGRGPGFLGAMLGDQVYTYRNLYYDEQSGYEVVTLFRNEQVLLLTRYQRMYFLYLEE